MDSSGFSSPRPECFPAGLRVLVVDDDPTWLKILEKMLKRCQYEVTTCNLAREALDLLRERKDGFDIVISDVNMPDMDGFKLLEHVGLEMDLPVIMMSVDGETSRVMKGVQHGACDYLLKPIRMKELRNIWQHVFRKKIHEVRDIEGYESLEEIQMMRNATELCDDGFMFSGDFVSSRKRKDAESKHNDDRMCGGDSSSAKKARVVWTVDLHQKFVKAVNQIGFEKVGPKKILDLMGVPWLTRENVASHLQKYRLYLTRLQKENELKATFGGTKPSDISSKDFTGNVCPITKNLTTLQHNTLPDENYTVPGPKITTPHNEPKINETKRRGPNEPIINEKKRRGPLGEANDLMQSSTSTISYDHSFRPLDSDVKPEPKIQVQYSWSSRVPPPQSKQEHKAPFQENGFDRLPRPVAKTNPSTPNDESDKPSYNNRNTTKAESTTPLFSIQPVSHHTIDPTPSSLWYTKNPSLDPNPFYLPEYTQRNMIVAPGSAIRLWDEGFVDYSPPVDLYQPNAYLGSLDPLLFANQDLVYDVSHDLLRFDPEFPSDMVEYPVINQGVPI